MTGRAVLRKEAAAAAEQEPSPFWQDGETYHGELARVGDWRLSVSPNGKRYVLQERHGESWVVRRWRKVLSALWADIPPELARELSNLPEEPERVPRPWATAMHELGARMRKASVASDDFAGTIWRGECGELRLVRAELQRGHVYAVQSRERGGSWKVLTQALTAARLFDAVNTRYPEGHRLTRVGMHKGLRSFIVRLPARACDAPGKPPERPADVRVVREPIRGSRTPEKATTGQHSAAQAQSKGVRG